MGEATRSRAVADEPVISVADLLQGAPPELQLRLAAGEAGLEQTIRLSRVQRPGLALTGYTAYIRYGRVQIVGASELGYLQNLSPGRRAAKLAKLLRQRISCFIVTRGLEPPAELLTEAEAQGVPILVSPAHSTTLVKQISAFLDDRLALRKQLHAVLMDVYGVGVLITGESGIGKSECALVLIDRGHRLVADDVVKIKRTADSLVGSSPEMTRYHMELRGLGVINIKDLYGVASIRSSKQVDLVVNLERWESGREYERLGLRGETSAILGLEAPLIRMPVAPGRNTAILVEVASRNQLLKQAGHDAARDFADRVDRKVEAESEPGVRRGSRRTGTAGRTRRR